MRPSRSTGTDAVEIVPGRLYAVGDTIPLDGRVSWAPAVPGRHQALSCYLLREGDEALLVDTGVRAFWPAIRTQLAGLLEPGSPLKVFVSRPELDSTGNLPELRELYDIEDTDVMAGGTDNPFDFFDTAVSRAAAGSEGPAPTYSVLRTTGFDLGPHRPVRVSSRSSASCRASGPTTWRPAPCSRPTCSRTSTRRVGGRRGCSRTRTTTPARSTTSRPT